VLNFKITDGTFFIKQDFTFIHKKYFINIDAGYLSFEIIRFIDMEMQQVNIFDEPIEECCSNPITGFFRDGFCHTDEIDRGLHIVCSLINDEFLDFSKSRGNDLSTPRPEFNFPGLKAGDSWCVCAERWKEAYEHGFAPKIFLKKTNKKTTSIIDIKILKEFAIDMN